MVGFADVLSIGGSLLGAFGGKSKKGDPVADYGAMQSMANSHALDYATKYPSAAAAGFEAAGIHPVYGFGSGAAMSSMPGVQIGDRGEQPSNRMAEMGAGISRAASIYQSAEDREMAKASNMLSIENQRLQNARLASEIALMSQPGTGPALATSTAIPGQGDSRYPLQEKMPLGFGDTAPFMRKGIDQNGNSVRVWNDDLGDNDVMQAATALGISLPEWLANNILMPMESRRISGFHAARQRQRFNKAKQSKWSHEYTGRGWLKKYQGSFNK